MWELASLIILSNGCVKREWANKEQGAVIKEVHNLDGERLNIQYIVNGREMYA